MKIEGYIMLDPIDPEDNWETYDMHLNVEVDKDRDIILIDDDIYEIWESLHSEYRKLDEADTISAIVDAIERDNKLNISTTYPRRFDITCEVVITITTEDVYFSPRYGRDYSSMSQCVSDVEFRNIQVN